MTADIDAPQPGLQSRPELFSAAMGRCGAVGIISEVELDMVPNACTQRQVKPAPLGACAAHFRPFVLTDPTAMPHYTDLLPPDFTAPGA